MTGRNDVASPPTLKLRHEFGDTKHRRVGYAVATTRFREYFPRDHERPNARHARRRRGRAERAVVASAGAADVLYVVPTWTWEEHVVRPAVRAGARRPPPTLTRTRSGGGLRVYLDRPWYSSGDDELLGVVLEDQPWITWPFEAAAGLTVKATAKALADELAERAITEGLVSRRGPPRRHRPRLPGAIQAAKPDARAARTRGRHRGGALAAHAAAEAALGEEAGPPRLTAPQQAQLDAILGLLFAPSGDPQKYVTHWGADPIWRSEPVATGPYIHQFPLRVAVDTGISLLEAPGHNVTVIGHEPRFDPVGACGTPTSSSTPAPPTFRSSGWRAISRTRSRGSICPTSSSRTSRNSSPAVPRR